LVSQLICCKRFAMAACGEGFVSVQCDSDERFCKLYLRDRNCSPGRERSSGTCDVMWCIKNLLCSLIEVGEFTRECVVIVWEHWLRFDEIVKIAANGSLNLVASELAFTIYSFTHTCQSYHPLLPCISSAR
jgi:hypothetical protein